MPKFVHKPRGVTVARFEVRVSEELRAVLGREADKAGVPMNEFIAQVLAQRFNRPELAIIPRKSFGRPRKEVAAASA